MAAPTQAELTGHRRTIAVDWDGTLVPFRYPEQPVEWMPGAVRALHDMASFANVVIWSARTNPWDPAQYPELIPLTEEHIASEIRYIRRMLDREGLTMVGIWTEKGKPTADVYIDDKAERYNGHKHSWDKMRRKIRMRFQEPNAAFPPWGPDDEEDDGNE